VLRHTEEEPAAAAQSLQAFVHYHRLYERWWSDSARVRGAAPHPAADAADEAEGDGVGAVADDASEDGVGPASGERLDFDASALLSERHAASQAARRSVGEIQERLAAMVLKHGRAQGGQLDPGENEADAQSSASGEPADGQGSADAGQR